METTDEHRSTRIGSRQRTLGIIRAHLCSSVVSTSSLCLRASVVKKRTPMQPARELMERVGKNEVVVGILATDHLWTDLVEISVRSGIDYLIIDLEHGPHGPE